MNITELLAEHSIAISDLSKSSGIPRSTISTAFQKPVNNWNVRLFKSVADELQIKMDDLYRQLNILDAPLTPFIKWVGGKRQLLGEINRILPEKYNRYYEPFIGGGAVLLNLAPKQAVINDLNEELINTWRIVKNDPNELMSLLSEHQKHNSKDYYLKLRAVDRNGQIEKMTEVERAARFIYMNKTGFNGLYRVNANGENNVPYGKYVNPNIADKRIFDISDYLNSNEVQILLGSYRDAVRDAEPNDLVYFDPPYIPLNTTASFTSYTSDGFGLENQKELRDLFFELTDKGVQVILSNSDTPLTRELYDDSRAQVHQVNAKRLINSNASKRGFVGEVLITNY